MSTETVSIVMATDDNYAPVLGVAINSMIQNVNQNRQYCISILYDDLAQNYIDCLENLSVNNVKVKTICIKPYMSQFGDMHYAHLSVATTYRLLIPQIFKDLDKVLYLDSDIIIDADISYLFDLDIGNAFIGAAHDAVTEKMVDYFRTRGIEGADAFNAGVLLINIKQWQLNHVGERCFDLLTQDQKREKKFYTMMDQDALNIVCAGKVAIFPMKWNFQWLFSTDTGFAASGPNAAEYQEAKQNIQIFHYASATKPWEHPELRGAEVFWKYARSTVFYEDLLMKGGIALNKKENELFDRYIFPWETVSPNERIIIYGGGEVGIAFLRQIRKTGYCRITAICDKVPNQRKFPGIPVIQPERLREFDKIRIVVAIESDGVRAEICRELINNGIDKSRIISVSPLRGINE